jgi:hypothetical protein
MIRSQFLIINEVTVTIFKNDFEQHELNLELSVLPHFI